MAKAQNILVITSDFVNSVAIKMSSVSTQGVALRIAGACMENRMAVFRMGDEPLTTLQIAALANITETDLEAAIPDLLRYGLLGKESDGALCFPPFAAQLRRSEVNKINGSKGGRPPASKATKAKSEIASPAKLLAYTKTNVLVADSWKLGGSDYERLMDELLAVTGLDRRDSFADRTLQKWLRNGYAPATIISVISSRRRSDNVQRLAWWASAIEEASNAQ
jgi:hypothetical protein